MTVLELGPGVPHVEHSPQLAVMDTWHRLFGTPEISIIQPTLDSLSKEGHHRVQQDGKRIPAIALEGHLYRSLIDSC